MNEEHKVIFNEERLDFDTQGRARRSSGLIDFLVDHKLVPSRKQAVRLLIAFASFILIINVWLVLKYTVDWSSFHRTPANQLPSDVTVRAKT